jgi:hypothetical protein
MLNLITIWLLRIAMKRDKIFINIWKDGVVTTYDTQAIWSDGYNAHISVVTDNSVYIHKDGSPDWSRNA